MSFLNPYLKGEEEDFYNTVKDFAKVKVFPSVEQRDEECTWDDDLWKEMGSMGLLGIPLPEEYGGQSGSCLQCCLAQEAFNAGSLDGGFGLSWGAHMIIGTLPILFQGTDVQKRKYLPKLASGEWIAGLGLTEPDSGSDAAGMRTFAEKTEGGFILNGSKMYITNGPIGHVFIIMARTTKSRGPMGVSAFIVEANWKGFQVSKVLKKLGHNTSTTAELSFHDMFVPDENLLGPLNSGFLRIGKATLEWERTVLLAALMGGMESAVESCIQYAWTRQQFGKPVLSFFAIKEKIARTWAYLCASRRILYFVSRKKDNEPNVSLPMESSLLKLFASEVAEEIASDAVQIFGGMGYMREVPVSRFYRDVKLGTIGGGTSEVQRNIVSSTYGGYDKFLKSLESAVPKETRKLADEKTGVNTVSELIDSLENLIRSVGDNPERRKKQSLEFGFADLLTVTVTLKLSLWDLTEQSGNYAKKDKERDIKILAYYIVARYLRGIVYLKELDKGAVLKILNAFGNLSVPETEIEDCIEFLKEGILGAAVSA
ncbi:acyl-CoA dehydrogenase [Leptospira gomenensis]|uniref:Cyclohexane-1-carbonyl-CoA dehydrogenase n=1 Tax=Leptospira gomenensis TaxID=2484974 RepID=A0A5F1Y678_9LEPT|nr:acyl-CoA dehydrogenase family protein [Leptospira gomenensis]TGK28168.1 acyl-CoA dehydrogenase [Leptospira gomenensis]TGK36978.1 acyl-CoA dehydrogenase [Leptospira gomenensis]TGK45614.1 acyl-CoA dehydrogenase [Leptospira gomenensis]TGK59553.1 acyl-CoA dehydrogenase [Leptospira gomenensis]